MSLYLTILLSAVAVPFIFSFDKKLQFWKQWKYLFISIAVVSSFYIVSDIILTGNGVWGFNPRYHSNKNLFGLPLEEWFFFLAIPYASVFLHDVFVFYFPKIKLGVKTTVIVAILLLVVCISVIVLYYDRIYTVYIFSTVIVALLCVLFADRSLLSRYFISFLLIMVPFCLVNSVLTGSFIEEEVFWYNPAEILGFRIISIPVEDAGFTFSMILMIIFVRDHLKKIY